MNIKFYAKLAMSSAQRASLEIAKLLPYFSEHVWSQCCCYATYRQPHETHECALTHGTRFDR